MANKKTANVLIVDTSAQFDGTYKVGAVKYIGNASGTASIKANSTAGEVVYEADGESDVCEQICLKLNHGMYVTITNGAKLYIYLE